jgi:hypothetical protein
MATKLSNVIGAPFKESVLRQLSIRARRNSTVSRTNDEVLFLANKTAWVRLTSSVNVITPPVQDLLGGLRVEGFGNALFYQSLGLNPADYPAPDSLAKNWILQAGTSKQSGNGISLRQGIGPDGAYGLGGTQELGYRPMPGLKSVQVETTGRLGSLKQATINFSVWNMNQLNIIEALYFRLGYSMLLEWGHTQYFVNKDSNGTVVPDGLFVRQGVFGIEGPFDPNTRKETIQQAIARKSVSTSGNYDGMLGIVSNFTWSFNQDGGYDCVVRLIGLGAVMDSMRINTLYTLPPELVRKYDQAADTLEEARRAEIQSQQPPPPEPISTTFNLPPTATSVGELYNFVKEYDRYTGTLDQFLIDSRVNTFADFSSNLASSNGYLIGLTKPSPNQDLTLGQVDQLNSVNGGFWFKTGDTLYRIPLVGSTEVKLNTKLIEQFLDVDIRTTTTREAIDNLAPAIAKGRALPAGLNASSIQINVLGQEANSINARYVLDNLVFPSIGGRSSFGLGPEGIYFGIEAYLSPPIDTNFPVTREIVIEELVKWLDNGAPAVVTGIGPFASQTNNIATTEDRDRFLKIDGVFETTAVVPNVPKTSSTNVTIKWKFSTNNWRFIDSVGQTSTPTAPTGNTAQDANTGDADGTLNQADDAQTTASDGLQSALTAMLAIIQTTSQEKALNNTKTVIEIDTTEQTREFYQAGILNKVFDATPEPLVNRPFDITQYALRGFNSELMIQPELYPEIDEVDFDFRDLCKAYLVRYPKILPDGSINSVTLPVYIKLGYLLAFLNNMCLFYDSKTKSTGAQQITNADPRPYVYIDFNPNTNFCLTAPQQLSVDPSVCLIPFEGTTADYKELFPPEVKTTGFFDPEKNNVITFELAKTGYTYNTVDNAYQGQIMNVLLNTEYLLRIIKEYANSDNEQSMNLQSFIERILVDVDKSLGNINAFNLIYRDDSNTLQIVDAQYVPKLPSEQTILNRSDYLTSLKQENGILSGQLPVFESPSQNLGLSTGTFSLTRDFQFRTTVSTKLASMIAISAQANTGSVNAKDHSSFSYLNRNFEDRYKPYIQDPPNTSKGSNSNPGGQSPNNKQESGDQKVASLFDAHIKGIYSSTVVTPDKVDMAKNYYIERMSKVKSLDLRTVSAPFIPADLEMTIDGISGVIMGNAFTIPESRLPISLRSNDGKTKVGFIVTGLSNTIENNEWLTRIKGQMIRLREDSLLRKPVTISGTQKATQASLATSTRSTIDKNPWSAAFINYVMKTAGVAFPADSFHTGYAQKLRKNKGTYNFDILDPAKTKLQPGDIIVKNRDNKLTFSSDPYTGTAHGDIVTTVSPTSATAIGGNLGDKVKQVTVSLKDSIIQAPDYFVVLRPPSNVVSQIIKVAEKELADWPKGLTDQSPLVIGTLRKYYQTIGVQV